MKNNLVIAIAREFGSGGREIGQLVAKKLDIPFYDKGIITQAAKESGIDERIFENVEDIANNSLIYSLSMGIYNPGRFARLPNYSINDEVYRVQTEIIRKVADEGDCVIVGRCADYLLNENPRCVRVFVHADIDIRLKRAIEVYGLPKDTGENFIRKKDRRRASYYQYYTDNKWGDYENYHLILDSGAIGIENASEVVLAYAKEMPQKEE